jgi:hypothetical protein
MVMFLMAVFLSLFGVAVSAIAFGAATREERSLEAARVDQPFAVATPRFFAAASVTPLPETQVPIELLLSQIESHVRLEQAVAQSFIDSPTSASLHSRTMSPLVH